MKKSTQYCWKKDDCQRSKCKFIHPRNSGLKLHHKDDVTKETYTIDSSLASLPENNRSSDALKHNENAIGVQSKDIATNNVSRQEIERHLKENEVEVGVGYQNNDCKTSNTRDSTIMPPQKVKNRRKRRPIYENSSYEHNQGSNSLKNPLVENCVESRVGSVPTNHLNDAEKPTQKKNDTKIANVATNQEKRSVKRQPTKVHTEAKAGKFDEIQHGQRNISTKDSGFAMHQEIKTWKKMCRFRSDCKIASCELSHSEDPTSIKSIRKGSFENNGCSEASTRQNARKVLPKLNATLDANKSRSEIISTNQATDWEGWEEDEANAIKQHRDIIGNIKDKICQIILSEDYSSCFEKEERNVLTLRAIIIELESHIFIYDSIKSRTCRELSSKPRELCNQIYREIYRLKCRLGAFAKRLAMEKYFTSGHRFLIVQGQTGSGKSTQIPQYVADHPRFYGQKIICTQPRKLAAITLSRRVSFEYSGGIVRNDSLPYIGYHVGGDKRQNSGCRIEFVTEGIMLERVVKGDVNAFKNVGCIIIDEAHERSITCDLLLGSFKKSDPRWNDILIITTSATIDLNLFSEYFNNAPIVQIDGRTFPVDIIYQPITDESNIQYAVAQCAFRIHLSCKSSPGDILCFLPGLEDLLNAKSTFERELKKVNDNATLLDFDWISPPSKEAVANAEKELTILGAVDSYRKPTELGNLIASCQQDPKIMKIVYSGCSACSIASILSVSNMFFWNGNDAESKTTAMQLRKQLAKPEGDIVTMYRIFEHFNNVYNGRIVSNSELAPKSEDTSTSNPKKSASLWCKDNSINQKTIFLALATRTELINQLNKTKIWSKFGSQKKVPTNLEVQELMCSGYFPQSARVFYSKNINAPTEYFSTESEVAGRLDFRSSLKLLDVHPTPKWIVYDKIVRLPNTIFPIASVMDENWLKEANPDFYAMCLKKTENLPTDMIVKSISQVSFRMIVGRNFCNVDSLEKELGCLLTGDAETGQMHLYCAPVKKVNIEQQIQTKIDDVLMEIKKQVVEEEYVGETRVVVGEGYEVHEILFENEFATFYVKNVKNDLNKAVLKSFLTMGNELLASLDCTYQDKTYTAVAKFSSKKDAKSAYERVSTWLVSENVTVSPSFGSRNYIRHGLTCRLTLTWPTAASKGIANIFFQTSEGANNFLDNAHQIYPSVIVHVCGETQRSAQRKYRGEHANVIEPPLTYLKLSKYDRRCRFRFDSGAIDKMPNKLKLNYKVILTGLKLSTDKVELMTTLNVYSPKNVIVEYEDITVPDFGNGLTPEEKAVKLRPLSRFMEANTKITDFFKRNTGVAGMCVFLTNNATAKEAYNHAKPLYDAMKLDSSPHRLEIEFTHMISIQIGLYTFLQPQLTELHREARSKGITSVTTPIHDNSKTVIIRFHTNHHSLLSWIQEKLDVLTRPDKFNCPNLDVLFKFFFFILFIQISLSIYNLHIYSLELED